MVRCGIVERWHIRQLTKEEISFGGFSEADKKYKISDMVDYCGCSRQMINQVINNKKEPSLELALRIYNYLVGCGYDWLIFEDVFYYD